MVETLREDVIRNKKIAVERIAAGVRLDSAEVERVVDTFVIDAVTPILYKEGGIIDPSRVALTNDCENNCNDKCKAELPGVELGIETK